MWAKITRLQSTSLGRSIFEGPMWQLEIWGWKPNYYPRGELWKEGSGLVVVIILMTSDLSMKTEQWEQQTKKPMDTYSKIRWQVVPMDPKIQVG